MEQADPGAAHQQQDTPPEMIHGLDGHKSEHQQNDPGDDDVKQDRADAVTGLAENLFGVVEDHVDAAPL